MPQEHKSILHRLFLWILLAPLALFLTLMGLLYVPPIQNYVCDKAAAVMSESLGMDITVGSIDLRFPLNLLIRDITINDRDASRAPGEVLLSLGSMNARVSVIPLFRGNVDIDDVRLENVSTNTGSMIDGVRVVGQIGLLNLESHGTDLNTMQVLVDLAEVSDADVYVEITEPKEPEDTTETVIPWSILLDQILLDNVHTRVNMMTEGLDFETRIDRASASGSVVDLLNNAYSVGSMNLSSSFLSLDMGDSPVLPDSVSLDFSHLRIRDLNASLDSLFYQDMVVRGKVGTFNLKGNHGLEITSLTAQFDVDSTLIRIPSFRLETPTSWAEAAADLSWAVIGNPNGFSDPLQASLKAELSKKDIFLFVDSLPALEAAYPDEPLRMTLEANGDIKDAELRRLDVELPTAFHLKGKGELYNVLDTLKRDIDLDVQLQTYDLSFLLRSLDTATVASFRIPNPMSLNADMCLTAERAEMDVLLKEGTGKAHLTGRLNTSTELYDAVLTVDSLYLPDFLLMDSLGYVSTNLKANGQGFDLQKPSTRTDLTASLGQLEYGPYKVSGVDLDARIRSNILTANLRSDNPLLRMVSDLSLRTDRDYLDGTINMDVEELNLYHMGFFDDPLMDDVSFSLNASSSYDSVKIYAAGGDLSLEMETRSTIRNLMNQGEVFDKLLTAQYNDRRLDHVALRQALPYANVHFKAGKENPLTTYLLTMGYDFDLAELSYVSSPVDGINGFARINRLSADGFLLDTIRIDVAQDMERLLLDASVVNARNNPQYVFKSLAHAEVRSEEAEFNIKYIDKNNVTGVDIGATMRPLAGGTLGRANGIMLDFGHRNTILAYHDFEFNDESDKLFIQKDARIYANIDMSSDNGLALRVKSDSQDTISLQNINVEVARFNLSELTSVMPYFPAMGGLLNVDAAVLQTKENLQLSCEGMINALTYESRSVGDIGLGLTYLPGTSEGHPIHYLDSYFTFDDEQVATASGRIEQLKDKEDFDIDAVVESLPVRMFNAFVPDAMVELEGRMNGDICVRGNFENPLFDGTLSFDEGAIWARQVGTRYRLSSKPVTAKNSRISFDQFAIYTNSENPFSVNGTIDCSRISNPYASLSLRATNYTLMDAPKTKESLFFGKIFVDFMATVNGRMTNLVMRGNMNVLGNTNATYQMMNTPLVVEDRLEGLVTFMDFSDTLEVDREETPMMLGGINMTMGVHIDDAVRLRANLTNDGNKFVELIGGGDLDMRYSPSGEISLIGRYTLSGGTMKYSIPVIPLKEFSFTQGSYVDWRGELMNPVLNLTASERVRAQVQDGEDSKTARRVDFDVSIAITGNLDSPDLAFSLDAPNDGNVQNELTGMGTEERSKAAITMLATGLYMNGKSGGNLSMGSALNSVLQSQINNLAGAMTNASLSVGIEDNQSSGRHQTDYSFRYSQRFFNDRVQINIGGTLSTGSNATNNVESFIDNVSLEYRLDNAGGRYLRAFHNKNYVNVLEGEVTETGVGVVFRKKVDRLRDLFIFTRSSKNKKTEEDEDENGNASLAVPAGKLSLTEAGDREIQDENTESVIVEL